ncbi:hypothetical protein PV326_013386, partial [Microctonus aethiopoides]
GEALRRAYKAKLRTVQDLINFIKENFDKPKTYFSLRNQILKLEQGTYESMSTYIARAQELLSDCTECLLTSNVPNKESARQTLNDDITNGFVHGTLKKYLRLFTTKNFPSFAAACAEARRAEGELAVFDMNKRANSNSCKYTNEYTRNDIPGPDILNTKEIRIPSAECKIANTTSYFSPSIFIKNNRIKYDQACFLIDTGSQLNLIKLNHLKNTFNVDKNIRYELNGVSKTDKPMTLGKIDLIINNTINEFHIIPTEFPLSYAGIIGTEFMQKNNAKIDYEKKL